MSPTPPKRLLATVCLVVLAVTAGCSLLGDGSPSNTSPSATTDATPTATAAAPTATDRTAPQATATPTDAGATATPDPSDSVAVDGNLSVNATRVFERVERLHGVDVDPPVVTVYPPESRSIVPFDSPFYRAFSVPSSVGENGTGYGGLARPSGDVYVFTDGTVRMKQTVVHEFAHHVHFQERWNPGRLPSVSDDESRAADAVVEGAAVYVTDRYAEQYDTVRSDLRAKRHLYNESGPAERLFVAKYIAGAEYVHAKTDSASELGPILTEYPETTEQVLHPTRNVSLGNLTVATNSTTGWSVDIGHFRSDADRRGELLVRELLRLELDREVADAAADGWDNDRSLTFESAADESTGVAWTLRFENATEADEFANAFDRFAGRRNESVSGAFAAERVAPETVTVFAGSDAFVEGASAIGTNESVRVAAPGADATGPAESVRPPSNQSTSRHPTTPQSAKP